MKFSKALIMRLVWFVVGAGISYSLNLGLFHFFYNFVGWNHFVAYALTLALANVVLFLWNYFVGFRTQRQWVGSAWRHAVCLSVANALDYTLFVSLHRIFPEWPAVIMAIVKACVAGFKFAGYHYWVYPVHTADLPGSAQPGSTTPGDDALPPRAN